MPEFLLPVIMAFKAVPSWLWKYIVIAAVAVTLYVAGDIHGQRLANARCERAAQKARDYANEQDRRAAQDSEEDDKNISDAIRAQAEKDDLEIKSLREELAKRPSLGANCKYPDARGLCY